MRCRARTPLVRKRSRGFDPNSKPNARSAWKQEQQWLAYTQGFQDLAQHAALDLPRFQTETGTSLPATPALSTVVAAMMAERGVKVLHCPGSNLKLGSGLAPVVEMRAKGISVSLGADGAACNNHLDMFEEMRLAAVLQSVRHRPGALTARDAMSMATREGAPRLVSQAKSAASRLASGPT